MSPSSSETKSDAHSCEMTCFIFGRRMRRKSVSFVIVFTYRSLFIALIWKVDGTWSNFSECHTWVFRVSDAALVSCHTWISFPSTMPCLRKLSAVLFYVFKHVSGSRLTLDLILFVDLELEVFHTENDDTKSLGHTAMQLREVETTQERRKVRYFIVATFCFGSRKCVDALAIGKNTWR